MARDLGIGDSTLHHWCQQLAEQDEQVFPGSGYQTAQEEEIRRLKRESAPSPFVAGLSESSQV